MVQLEIGSVKIGSPTYKVVLSDAATIVKVVSSGQSVSNDVQQSGPVEPWLPEQSILLYALTTSKLLSWSNGWSGSTVRLCREGQGMG